MYNTLKNKCGPLIIKCGLDKNYEYIIIIGVLIFIVILAVLMFVKFTIIKNELNMYLAGKDDK